MPDAPLKRSNTMRKEYDFSHGKRGVVVPSPRTIPFPVMSKNGMRPVHPGEVLLEDYIKPMGISVRALSLALHVPYSRLREIVDGNRGVSADTALRLERHLGSEAQDWLNLQSAYDLRVAAKSSAKLISKEIAPWVAAA
jgi:addiction module HigA family antidote